MLLSRAISVLETYSVEKVRSTQWRRYLTVLWYHLVWATFPDLWPDLAASVVQEPYVAMYVPHMAVHVRTTCLHE